MKKYLRTWLRRLACAWRPRTLVLVYHHVWNPSETLPWITTPPDQFAEHMALLSALRLAIPLDTLLSDLRQGRCRNGGRVVVTFDDATVDTLGVAYPILRRYGIPATVFVPTGLIGTGKPLWWNRLHRLGELARERGVDLQHLTCRPMAHGTAELDNMALWHSLRQLDPARREEELAACAQALGICEGGPAPVPMSWDQLAALDRSELITLGAHTVTHPMLSTLQEAEMVGEVRGSRAALAHYAAFRPVFAYPYGDPPSVSEQCRRVLDEAGFEAAFTTAPITITGTEDRMSLGRVSVDSLSIEDFRWLIDHSLCN